MSNTNGKHGVGTVLAAKLGLTLGKREGHDLAGACVACESSDAFRVHMESGVAHCYACQGGWSPFDLAKVVLKDAKAAHSMMVDLGVFEPSANGNGRAAKSTPAKAPDPIGEIARMKSVPRESLVAYGATVHSPKEVRLPVYGPDGTQISYFRLFTHPESKGRLPKGGKAGVFLPHVDGKVRLPQAGETWHAVEGCKDAAALHSLGLLGVGLHSSSMNVKFARLFVGTNMIMVPDRDTAGERGASKAGGCLYGVAASVRIATLPAEFKKSKGEDVRDVLKRDRGRELVLTAIADAQPWEPGKDGQSADDRPEIDVTPDEHLVNDQAVASLARDESLFQRSGDLVQIMRDHGKKILKGITRPENAPRIVSVRDASLRERLSAVARFVKRKGSDEGEQVDHIHPPTFCVAAVAARGHWPGIRHLEGVVSSPILRIDGTVLQTPGYDPATGLLYEPEGGTLMVSISPTRDDAVVASNELLEVVADFPFATPEHRAAWLAFLLTPLARHAFSGPSPLYLIDANVRGSGKGLLADAAAIIVTGREVARMPYPNDEDETRKRITAVALNGDQVVLIDNIVGNLGGASLDAALTSNTWKDRILGRSEIVEMPLVTTWAATGNNVAVVGDMGRRICHIRLHSALEKPEERDDIKHKNLRQWIRSERPRLLPAALTILSAYCRAGRPSSQLKPWGSFEGWSDLVRQAIVWVGLPDPGDTREELRRASDREASALRAIIRGWAEIDPDGTGLTSAKIIERLEKSPDSYELLRSAVLELCPAQGGKLPSTRSLGNKLRALRGRNIGGKAIDCRDSHGTALWSVQQIGPMAATASCSGGSSCSASGRSRTSADSAYVNRLGGNGRDEQAGSEQPEQPDQLVQYEEGEF